MEGGLPKEPSLPEAPQIDRRIRIPAFRTAGLAVIALVPVLAVFGVFGERWASVSHAHGAVAVEVEYPTRYRCKMLNSIVATVTNQSSSAGEPTVIAARGRFLQEAMNRERVQPGEVYAELRKAGLEQLSEAKYIVLEDDGKLSIVPAVAGRPTPREESDPL